MKKTIYWGLIISLILAALLSPFASVWPDGLEKVAAKLGFLGRGEGRQIFNSPLSDYTIPGVKNGAFSVALAGLVGTLLVFGVAYGAGKLIKRGSQTEEGKRKKVGA